MTVLIFIARAFISGGFQAAYVYTPEVSTEHYTRNNCEVLTVGVFLFCTIFNIYTATSFTNNSTFTDLALFKITIFSFPCPVNAVHVMQ